MSLLRELGLRREWIYEVLLSTSCGDTPHAAPIGVWTTDFETLRMHLYGEPRTLRNVRETGYCVANFPSDEQALGCAILSPHDLAFHEAGEARAPRLREMTAYVELELAETSSLPDRTEVVGRVVGGRATGRVRLINRAAPLLVESLILASRLPRRDRAATLATIRDNARTVHRVAPRSPYGTAMGRLLRSLPDP